MKKEAHICRMPLHTNYASTGWAVLKHDIGRGITGISCLPGKDLIAIAVSERLPFTLPEDDYHWEWSKEGKKTITQL